MSNATHSPSTKQVNWFLGIPAGVIALVLAIALSGCQTSQADTRLEYQPPVRKETKTKKEWASEADAALILPSGNYEDGLLLVEMTGPSEIKAGSRFTYELRVENLSDNYRLRDVQVEQEVPATLVVESDSLTSTDRTTYAEWGIHLRTFSFGTLNPGQSRTAQVTATTPTEGELLLCATADYTPLACWSSPVVAPEITVTKAGPSMVCYEEPIEYTITVKNVGTGTAEGLTVMDRLPDGLTASDARDGVVTRDIGDLAAGESETVTITANASRTGSFTNYVDVAGQDDISVRSNEIVTDVRRPVLRITKSASSMEYMNARFDYTITVANEGDMAAQNLVIVDSVPATAEFVNASGNGTFADGEVTWKPGELAPGESVTVFVTLRGTEENTITNTATANAYCANEVSASSKTQIVGIAALLLEVIDTEDPVKLGQNGEYVITVKNQGNTDATNVRVDFVPEGQRFLSVSGPSQGTRSGNTVQLGVVPRIAPGDTVEWTITTEALEAGDQRFYVNLTSDQLTRPVRETESTTLYTEAEVQETVKERNQ